METASLSNEAKSDQEGEAQSRTRSSDTRDLEDFGDPLVAPRSVLFPIRSHCRSLTGWARCAILTQPSGRR